MLPQEDLEAEADMAADPAAQEYQIRDLQVPRLRRHSK
jgi:hypothetical protein